MAHQEGSSITPASSVVSLDSIVDELFGGARTTYRTRAGRLVTFSQAKFKQIARVTMLFQEMLNRIPKDKFREFLNMVVEAQTGAMAAGKSQNDLSLNAVGMIEKALGENSMLLTLFATLIDILPEFMPHFCDLTEAEFSDLDLDEALVVASGVVAVNYSFFTRTLPPLVKSAIGGWQRGTLRNKETTGSASLTGTATS